MKGTSAKSTYCRIPFTLIQLTHDYRIRTMISSGDGKGKLIKWQDRICWDDENILYVY